MVTAHVGNSALVRLTGRLDGEWSRHLADTLDELLRDGLRSVVLEMSQVEYLSSPGLHVLGQRYRDFSALRGELRVSSPSPAVLQALTAAGLLDHLLLLPGDVRVAGGPGRPSAALVASPGEFTGDSWQVPSVVGPAGH
jgi:anti-anti-sigma factor